MPNRPYTRKPNSETFELGHYEVMQLELALDVVIRTMQPNGELHGAAILDDADERVLRDLRKMVAHRSAVSLTASVETL